MGDRSVVGVPGLWKDRGDLLRAIAAAGGREPAYLAMGEVMLELATKTGFGFEVYERNPALTEAFEAAGQGKIPPEVLKAIDRHTLTVYLVSPERSVAAARSLLRTAAHLLRAGGLAVKVESAGVAHAPEKWRYLAASPSTLSLYDAFVTLVGAEEYYYSCGMHAFNLPDASVTSKVPLKDGAEILTSFNHRQLLDPTPRKDGELFRTGATDPSFKTRLFPYGYGEEDLLNNPFGRWHMELAAKASAQGPEEPLFMMMKNDDPRLLEAMKKARATVGYFTSCFESPFEYGLFLFKAPIRDGDQVTHLWLHLAEVRKGSLVGEVFEAPRELKSAKVGQRLEVKTETISDWSIRKYGTLVGGYTLRLNREYTKPELRSHWDLHTGIVSRAPLDEIPS